MIIHRLCNPLLSRSFFLFGARGTGKTTYINEQFSKNASVTTIDLLDPDVEEKYSQDPKLLERQDLDILIAASILAPLGTLIVKKLMV